MINGKKYAWEDITIRLPHGTLVDVESIDYEDDPDLEAQYGAGRTPNGYSYGNYKASGKVSVKREEFDKMVEHAGDAGIYGLKPFPITVSYEREDGKVVTDTLPAVLFGKTSTGSKQGDKNVMVQRDLLILEPIKYGGKAAIKE